MPEKGWGAQRKVFAILALAASVLGWIVTRSAVAPLIGAVFWAGGGYLFSRDFGPYVNQRLNLETLRFIEENLLRE